MAVHAPRIPVAGTGVCSAELSSEMRGAWASSCAFGLAVATCRYSFV